MRRIRANAGAKVQIAIVTAIREEFAAVEGFLTEVHTEEHDGLLITCGQLQLPGRTAPIEILLPAGSPASAARSCTS